MDINSREDIEQLVNAFYTKVKKDPVIGFIFNEVIKMNWEDHLPIMYNFWETILLDKTTYTRNAMGIHFDVNRKVKLEESHFNRWLELFTGTVDELFSGEKADTAKKRASSIAAVMLFKMNVENEGLLPIK